MGRYGKLIWTLILGVLLCCGTVSAVNLTFSPVVPTLIPTTVGQYYQEINASNLSWVVIGGIVPKPLVDTIGGGAFGWAVVWLWVLGTMFIIMFGRQKNVFLPTMVFFIIAFFVLSVILEEMKWIFYVCSAASILGIIVYLARKK